MEPTGTTDQVTVETGSARIDGIVADMPSAAKAVVAVMDRQRGPVLRTVLRTALAEREEEGPDDRALRLLVRRSAPAARGGARGGPAVGHGRAGHTRAAMHRPTGK
jgi:hypothetical protein